nr:COP1-interacting protein 7 [Coffea arabica]XP_027116595.1 COP1-interacting protein 7 [Coffea arabica]
MKSTTRLDSAVFHLTPTRTRCDLFIIANGKKEKIASGLLNPFLAHLKTARDQIEKGGYSIVLEPEPQTDASWFTKGTVERFVRFVSTPEILERVHTVESEILQIEEAITLQGSNDAGQKMVEDHEVKPLKANEGSKSSPDLNDEKAIVLYKPEATQAQTSGEYTQDGNSKVQLLKVLETRKQVLRKEQGMAFARAVAAGFDVDDMAPLASFAECFGASRLKDASSKFINLWKKKHETGQWVEIEATEALSGRSDFSAMNASGIVLSSMGNKQNDFNNESASENNEKSGVDINSGEKPPMNHQPSFSQQDYFQGQFPHPMYPPWPMHSANGSMPMFPPYPVQGMPYYQAFPGGVPFYQPPYPPMEDTRFSASPKNRQKRQSMDDRDDNYESEISDMDTKSRLQESGDLDKEGSQHLQSRKKDGRSGKKQSGVVVIRNINYITSEAKNSTGDGSESEADSESGIDDEDYQADNIGAYCTKTSRSSKRKGDHSKSKAEPIDNKEESIFEKDTDGGHWAAFQNFLLKGADEENHTSNEGMFAKENAGKARRRQNTVIDDPSGLVGRDSNEILDRRMTSVHEGNGYRTRIGRGSNDEGVLSRGGYNDARGPDDPMDMQYAETKGRRFISRTSNDDFMVGRREKLSERHNSSDPLAVNEFEHVNSKLHGESSCGIRDESFIVPFRSMALNQAVPEGRTAIDMDSELPSSYQNSENLSSGIRKTVSYEPDDMSLIPERGTEKRSVGYDPALDYEMQVSKEGTATLNKGAKAALNNVKATTKKSEKTRSSKGTSGTLDKERTGGPIRKGKPSKTSPLEDARARAERIRAFKADIQKMKKEKEEADLKRLEALKLDRQKRIAARCGSTSAGSTAPSLQTRKLPTKLSPISHRGSKFSDSEPGSSSPLQRSKVRTSLVSNESRKASKSSKLSEGGLFPGNRLTRSASSLSDPKKDSSGVTPESKTSMARIRRLSEPKTVGNHSLTSTKVQSAERVSKLKLSDEPDSTKMSAIMNLDKRKAATLPELKLKTTKGPSNVVNKKLLLPKETRNIDEAKPSATSGSSEFFVSNVTLSQHTEADDYPIVEKNVVLENDKPSLPVLNASGAKIEISQFESPGMLDQSERVSNHAAIRAPPSPSNMVDEALIPGPLQRQSNSNEVNTSRVEESSKSLEVSAAEKPYHAPFARISSLEDPCTRNSDYGKAVPTSSGTTTSAKAYVVNEKSLQIETIPEALAKVQVKESPKGLRKLLKFGKKSHSTAAGDQSLELDNATSNGFKPHNNASCTGSGEVHTLKNLISEDETPTSGNASQKSSRHFSLLSSFRSKTGEKKLTT